MTGTQKKVAAECLSKFSNTMRKSFANTLKKLANYMRINSGKQWKQEKKIGSLVVPRNPTAALSIVPDVKKFLTYW